PYSVTTGGIRCGRDRHADGVRDPSANTAQEKPRTPPLRIRSDLLVAICLRGRTDAEILLRSASVETQLHKQHQAATSRLNTVPTQCLARGQVFRVVPEYHCPCRT